MIISYFLLLEISHTIIINLKHQFDFNTHESSLHKKCFVQKFKQKKYKVKS